MGADRHPPVARRDRGVPRPPRPPRGYAAVTLREGGTPLVHSDWLSGLTGGEVWLKVEGDNPTGSFKDRGMTAAISGRQARGRRGGRLRLHGQHVGLDGGLCRQGRPQADRADPRRARSPPARWPRRSCTAPRSSWSGATSTTACDWPSGLARDYPVALVNSVNPVRLQGQKTAAFEICDFLGDAPDFHLLPVGNAGNISAYWLGYRQYADLGRATKRPRMRGFQAEGAAPLVTGEPFPDPETKATAIRIGNPASWHLAEMAAKESEGRLRGRLRRADPRRAGRAGPQRRRLRRARLGRGHRRPAGALASRAGATPGRPWSITVTGHGLKDTATALESPTATSSTRSSTPTSTRLLPPPVSPDMTTFVEGAVRVTVPADLGQPRARASTRLGLALSLRDELEAEVLPDGLVVEVEGAGAEGVPRDESHLVVRAMRAAFELMGAQPPGPAALVPQRRSRTPAASAPPRRRSSPGVVAGPRAWSRAASCSPPTRRSSTSRPTSRATPTTSHRPSTAAS